jgi:hypothetical protein
MNEIGPPALHLFKNKLIQKICVYFATYVRPLRALSHSVVVTSVVAINDYPRRQAICSTTQTLGVD